MSNRSFKILGVRPMEGCSKPILKNLTEGKPYMFYHNYTLNSGKVVQTHERNVPKDFYGNNISIHAIVGKNGCGKSTIVEFLFRLINNLAFQFLGSQKHTVADPLGYVKGLAGEFFYEIDGECFIVRQSDHNTIDWLDGDGISLLNNKEDKSELMNLFYTLVVNYSHYAYDVNNYKREIFNKYSKSCWIQSIFHKNDGYETPIVLNPYRENGDIEINRENDLATARLISLFIKTEIEETSFHEKYSLAAFNLTLKNEKYINEKYNLASKYWSVIGIDLSDDFESVSGKILEMWSKIAIYAAMDVEKDEYSMKLSKKYLVYKTISIIYKYTIIREYYYQLIKKNESLNKDEKIEKVLYGIIERLNSDSSHITLKLRQTLWFIEFQHYREESNLLIDELVSRIKKHTGENKNLDTIMNFLPPPIFDTIIKLKYKTEKKRTARIELTELSSGERQQLYSRSSLLYHLINLDSIEAQQGRIKYNNIEIILEEIELYYHPEYQRSYIQSLIDSINLLQLKSDIYIDICIITHSPIVLSDIPLENILFLDEGEPKVLESKKNTFGSNFYDLLKYNFFLTENAFGEFASKKIKLLITELNNGEVDKKTQEQAKEVIALIGDDLVAKVLTQYLD
ncbi:ABC transporter ATP-binding protein [uncultured Bacteroides sp.]|uniref:ABC transporter ATP-binding protein n=1 Tax=uncultured Bacteroides sp. TaxID=162156 RepID=UPI002AAA7A69|nr:ABC transporter ATP-binding protein [uncultured Bacteroides sp.]